MTNIAAATTKGERTYGVAIRADGALFLELRIRRKDNGEVFVMWNRECKLAGKKKWNPHASFHEDKNYHHKSFDHPFFQGNEFAPINTPLAAREFQGNSLPFKSEDFAAIFEIPVEEISEIKCRPHLRVELTAPGEQPKFEKWEKVRMRKTFDDAVPWIDVTLYDYNLIKNKET